MGKDFFTLTMKELNELTVPKAVQLTVWRAIQYYQKNSVSECFNIAFTLRMEFASPNTPNKPYPILF